MKDKSIELFNREGESVELDDVQRVRLVCFNCNKHIEDKFATLISPSEEFFSDEVYKNSIVYLCTRCYRNIMRSCGSIED